jgi:tRNA(Ile)-lysidine synthase
MPKNLVKKIQNTISEKSLFERGARIVLGISGGSDSVAMLDIFSKLQKKYDLELVIAHVNYQLRAKDSELDERFVQELAKKYRLEIFIFRSKIEKNNPSENILRDIRYEFFEKTRKKKKFNLIAVAHNADDQAETFLSRIIRGAGLSGLSGMKYKNNKVIRPLLAIWKTEILEYLNENKLAWREDKTNLKSKYFRNKIRNKLIPFLEKDFNPSIKRTVLGSIESISEDADHLSRKSKKELGKNGLSVSKIVKNDPSIQKRILLEAIKKEKGDLKDIDSAHIREILKIVKSTKGKRQIVVLGRLKIERIGDKLKMSSVN